MKNENIINEIQLASDECCIVFDFACAFPYSNPEILTFNFALGSEEFDDYKLNHRFSSKEWQTISKKYGRKISKIGYPYIMKLKEQAPMLLCIRIGIKEQYITMIFPVQTDMTKDSPVCGVSFRYDFDKCEFVFTTYEKNATSVGWKPHTWRSHKKESERFNEKNDIWLNAPCLIEEAHTMIFEDVIEPCASRIEDLLLR